MADRTRLRCGGGGVGLAVVGVVDEGVAEAVAAGAGVASRAPIAPKLRLRGVSMLCGDKRYEKCVLVKFDGVQDASLLARRRLTATPWGALLGGDG